MHNTKPTALIILDGFGYSSKNQHNAIALAKTPFLDYLQKKYPSTYLKASGAAVGLPAHENGNSEVGHFTIGAGKITPQTSLLLKSHMQHKALMSNQTLMKELKKFNPKNKIHLIGMISDGGVHSNISHTIEILKTLHSKDIKNVYVHAILDGRDTPPQSADKFIKTIQKELQGFNNGHIVTVHGRHYAMDRDHNDDRTQASFNVMTEQSKQISDIDTIIKKSYEKNIYDEYITPQATHDDHTIQQNDGIIFLNFRPDRAKQITQKLLSLKTSFFITPVLYDTNLPTTPLIKAPSTSNTLLEKINDSNKTICTITETEKFNHLTYFFNGHRDIQLTNETRIMIPSHKVMTHDQKPEMKAAEITDHIIAQTSKGYDFYLANFANADMVGHTGNLPATIKAIEIIDQQLHKIYTRIVQEMQGTIFITADHGNAEKMFNQSSNQPCTSHTNNRVPFYAISSTKKDLTEMQGLSDIAKIILEALNID